MGGTEVFPHPALTTDFHSIISMAFVVLYGGGTFDGVVADLALQLFYSVLQIINLVVQFVHLFAGITHAAHGVTIHTAAELSVHRRAAVGEDTRNRHIHVRSRSTPEGGIDSVIISSQV